jgi:hypothetical protein
VRRIVDCALVVLLAFPILNCGGGDDEIEVHATKVGNPLFEPVDFHKVSTRIGVPDDGWADFPRTLETLLPLPNHQPHPSLGIGPGAAHAGPYDAELAGRLKTLGLADKDVFRESEFTGGEGVFLLWMVTPTSQAPNGSSPDFQSGRIIPSSVFPITVHAELFGNGESWFDFGFDVPALDGALDPPFAVEGHSHFPLFFATNGDGEPLGAFEWRFTMRDRAGNGWDIRVPFTVEP